MSDLVKRLIQAVEDHHATKLLDEGIDAKGIVAVVLAAIEASGTHVVAPVEPDTVMEDAGDDGNYGATADWVYRTMIAARPKVTP